MVPRNLRKPTLKRCRHWWDEFTSAWYGIGIAYSIAVWGDD